MSSKCLTYARHPFFGTVNLLIQNHLDRYSIHNETYMLFSSKFPSAFGNDIKFDVCL